MSLWVGNGPQCPLMISTGVLRLMLHSPLQPCSNDASTWAITHQMVIAHWRWLTICADVARRELGPIASSRSRKKPLDEERNGSIYFRWKSWSEIQYQLCRGLLTFRSKGCRLLVHQSYVRCDSAGFKKIDLVHKLLDFKWDDCRWDEVSGVNGR